MKFTQNIMGCIIYIFFFFCSDGVQNIHQILKELDSKNRWKTIAIKAENLVLPDPSLSLNELKIFSSEIPLNCNKGLFKSIKTKSMGASATELWRLGSRRT